MTEARINRHDEHEIEFWQDFLQRGHRSRRVYGQPDAFAQAFDALDGAVQIVITFTMDDERIGAGLDKLIKKKIRIRNHEVRFQRQTRYPAQRFDDWRAHGNVRHKMS